MSAIEITLIQAVAVNYLDAVVVIDFCHPTVPSTTQLQGGMAIGGLVKALRFAI